MGGRGSSGKTGGSQTNSGGKQYSAEAYREIYRKMFGVPAEHVTGASALGSYRNMLNNIKLNYSDVEGMAKKLNTLIMPYFDDIKANPNKTL